MKIKILENGILPKRATAGAAGYDIYNPYEDFTLNPGESKLIKAGFCVEIPEGFEMTIRSRSGWAIKDRIESFFGTIDSDYRGEVGVFLSNLGTEPKLIKKGDRIAQFVLSPIITPELEIVEELSSTSRGEGGFGSTGKN